MDYSMLFATHEFTPAEQTRGILAQAKSEILGTSSGSDGKGLFRRHLGGFLAWDPSLESLVNCYVGIIDILQLWTFKKKCAHVMKKTTIGWFREIDTEPPAYYAKTFLKHTVVPADTARVLATIERR